MSESDEEEMIEVQLMVTLQVLKADNFDDRRLEEETAVRTARAAVQTALDFADEHCFDHPEADWLCVGYVDVETLKPEIEPDVNPAENLSG